MPSSVVSEPSYHPNAVSRYGRVRKASAIAEMIIGAYYLEEGFASGWHAYLPLADFMGNNFSYCIGAVCDAEDNCWCLTGNKIG